MAAKPGNNYAVKLRDPETKSKAYLDYCDHISKGLPKKAWHFKHNEISLTWETMDVYIKENPDEFPPSQRKEAEAKSLLHWFGVLSDIATGKNPKGNVAAAQIIMRNMFKWDRVDIHSDEDTAAAFIQVHENLIAQLVRHQQEKMIEVVPEAPAQPS